MCYVSMYDALSLISLHIMVQISASYAPNPPNILLSTHLTSTLVLFTFFICLVNYSSFKTPIKYSYLCEAFPDSLRQN